jgi:cell division protein FtsQ
MDRRGRELREIEAGSGSSRVLPASVPSNIAKWRSGRARLRRPKSETLPTHLPKAQKRRRDVPLPLVLAKRLRSVRIGLGIVTASAIALGLGLTTEGGQTVRAGLARLPDKDAVARFMGFGLDQVGVTGQRFTFDGDIFDALDLASAKSAASFDTQAVKSRIERLPWVATAEITRGFPGRLDIRISERQPFAVWRRGGSDYLVDKTGRVLGAAATGAQPGLPRISGEGAANEAASLLALVESYPDIARRLVEAERVGERRWTLKLSGGVVLNLPASQDAAALNMLTADAGLKRIVAGENSIVDLRAPGRVTVRNATDSPAARGCDGKST